MRLSSQNGIAIAFLNLNIDWAHHKWALFYCLVSTIGALCYGYDTIYYTGIQGMKAFIHDYGDLKSDGTYALSTTFLSVTASLIYVGEFTGALITAPINDAWGRKAVFLSASICIILGAIVQLVSDGHYSAFCVGRVLVGLGIGQFTASCLIYIGEVASAEFRGPALMMFQFMQSISQFVVSCIDQGTESIPNKNSYHISMGLLILLPGLMIILLPFIPETDLKIIQDQVNMELEMEDQSSWISLFRDPVERRKLIYSCGAMFAQQINGIQFWYTYGVVFAQSIGTAQPFTINTITNVLQIVAVGLSVLLGNKMRRRVNLLVCTCGMLISHCRPFSKPVGITIVVFSYINIICFNFSIGTLSYTIASEMAVGRNRNKITAAAIGVFFLTVWLLVFVSPYLYFSANLGPMIGFVFGGTALFTLAYVWFCVGETTGRTNTEIDRFFLEYIPIRKWRTHDGSEEVIKVSQELEKV
ncbi:general substrate transporter [Hyaloscypha hepaticicola]|uniref:General substrate transporter n=1 Tax=Hyaloscypha hepaticicola TaxID=2082293 RepID=A0A2J6PF83_9HELO|nr:general substrate transporter [Hyaloscypha hepaticicola]